MGWTLGPQRGPRNPPSPARLKAQKRSLEVNEQLTRDLPVTIYGAYDDCLRLAVKRLDECRQMKGAKSFESDDCYEYWCEREDECCILISAIEARMTEYRKEARGATP